MTKTSSTLLSALVAVALALPTTALAQRARTGGGDGGGSAGRPSSPQPSAGTARPRSAPAAPSTPSAGSSASRPSAGSTRAAADRPAANGGGTAVRSGSDERAPAPRATGRTAQPRPAYQPPNRRGAATYFNYTYPYVGFGLYSGFGYYDPWYYGAGAWNRSRWGYGSNYWHGPYLFDPFGYAYGGYPYYWGRLSNRESWASTEQAPDREPSGSLRLRVSPREAKVYVDGALAGIVDEFDGLTNHLRLPAGPHQIEFRADGYETLTLDVTVPDGKTRTERASLKKR